MRRIPNIFELNALSITLYYLIFAVLWILLSDQALIWITERPELISQYQTYKGLFYVSVTALLIYIFIDRSNKKITKDKERIDQALFAANTATWSLDLNTKKIQRSKLHHKLFGVSKNPRKWDTQAFYNAIHPEDRDKVRSELQNTIKKEKPQYDVEFRIIHEDGSVHWMRSSGNLIYDRNENPTHLAGVISDITEKKRLEEDYVREKELFESIFQHIPVMIDVISEDMKAIRVNNRYEEVTGYTQEEIQHKNIMDEVYPDPDERARAEKAIEEADGTWHEFENYTKEGDKRIQEWANIELSDGRTIGIGLDVTEKRKLEKEHERDRLELQKIYDNIPVFISLYKENNQVHRINEHFENVLGYGEKDLDSADLIFKLIPDRENRLKAEKHLDEADGSWLDFKLTTKDGTIIDSSWSVIPVTNSLKMGIGLDTTVLKSKEKDLQELTKLYKNAEKLAQFGHWKRNLETNESLASDGFYNILEMDPNEEEITYSTLKNVIHPDDWDSFEEAIERGIETGSIDTHYRILKTESKELAYIHELGKVDFDNEGNPISISGTIQDMTELEEFQIKLKQRNDFIETTLENLPIGVAVNLIDSGKLSLMNSKFSEIYGWPQDVLKDVPTFFKKVYPDEAYRNKIMEMIMADINSRNPERMHWQGIKITTQSGEEKIVNAKNIPLYDQNLMISTVVDVTAQAEAEKRLAESEHNYRLLFQKSPQPMWIYNPETLKFIEVNNAATKHYGYSRKEFYQMTLMDIRPEEDHEALKQEVATNQDESLSATKEWRHVKKSGEIIFVRITGSSINYFGNNYRLVLVNDITEQKEAERKVLASLVEGENRERARIAQELHDGLGQYLAAANMNLESVSSSIEKLDERKQKQFKKGHQLLRHAVNETGQISRNLLPRVVDDYGLALAIEALVDNYNGSTEIEIKYYHNTQNLQLPREVQLNLYRITQEALSNAIKYSEASVINVQLIKDQLDLILSIDDNGIGFDTEADDFTPGLGLQTIRTRVGALGGEFEFDSKPSKGTFINVVVPINMNFNVE